MELFLARHGQSEGNLGSAADDPPLTALGNAQAAALGDALRSVRLDLIVSSPLRRALETAAAVAGRQRTPSPVLILPAVAECGTPADFVPAADGVRKLLPDARFGGPPLADYKSDFERRDACLARLRALAYETADGPEDLLIVAHGTFNAMLIFGLLGAKPPKNVILSQGNACVNRFSFFTENETPRMRLVSLNDLNHLQPAQRT